MSKRYSLRSRRAWFDLGLMLFSIAAAIFLGYTHAFQHLFSFVDGFGFLGIFFVGLFFTSVFTVAPSIVALGQISYLFPPFQVIFWGAIGATIADYILFRFVKERILVDMGYFFIHSSRYQKIMHLARQKRFRYLALLFALFLIASPLPDETALTLLGASKSKTKDVLFIMFFANALGIAVVIAAAHAFLV